jgi:hypothetical protein
MQPRRVFLFLFNLVGQPLRVFPWGAASAAPGIFHKTFLSGAAAICTRTLSSEEARECARLTLAQRRPFATQPHWYAASRRQKKSKFITSTRSSALIAFEVTNRITI